MENAIMEFVIEKFEQFCEEENYQKVKDYLTQLKGLANYNNGYFFEIVADKGNLELIKLFVQNGADIHVDNNYLKCIDRFNFFHVFVIFLFFREPCWDIRFGIEYAATSPTCFCE
jgi:hypothetical protein